MKRLDMSTFGSVLALLSVMVLGCGEVQKASLDAEAYYKRGVTWTKKSQYDEAIADLNMAIEINPRYVAAYAVRGSAYGEKGQWDQAISDFSKAIELDPRGALAAMAYLARGVAYLSKGQNDQAISDYTKGIELDPKLDVAYAGRGLVYEKKGQFDQAISDYNKALEIDPRNDDAINRLAWLLATCPDARYRNGAKAMELAQKAVELYPKAFSFDTLAAAYAEAGRFEDAIITQEKAITLLKKEGDPDALIDKFIERLNSYKDHMPWREKKETIAWKTSTPVQIYTKGAEYAAQGRFKEAKEAFERALKAELYFPPAEEGLKLIEDVIDQKIKSETAIHFYKGVAYRLKGQLADAITEFSKAIEMNPMFALAYNNRGIAYRWKGQLDQAISDHNRAIKINPRYVIAYISRGITYKKKRQLAEALANYNKAIELNPNKPWAYFYRGEVYSDKSQYDQAILDFTKAIEINPKDAHVYNSRGIVYGKKGQSDQAISDFNKAIELNPKFDWAYNNRGYSYQLKGQYDKAISDYNRAIETNPKHAMAYNNRAISYFYKGEYDKAWSDIHKAQSLGYQVSPKFLEALRGAEAIAAAFTFKEISRTEKILNNGKEPRQKLRYEFQEGRKHILVMDMQTDMSIEMGDYRQPEIKSPVIQMKVAVNCQEVFPEGNLYYEFKFDTVEIIDEMGMPPEQVAVTKANVKNIEGISGWMIVSPRGATLDGKFNLPPNFNPILKQMLDTLFHQFQNLSVTFPEQPVGIDSQWQVTWHFAKPSEIIQVAKFKLVDLKGKKGKLKVSLEQNAKPHKAEFLNLPPGSTVRIESMKSTGTGSIIFDLTKPVPKSEAEIGSSVKGIVEAGDQKVDMDMDINIRVKIQSK